MEDVPNDESEYQTADESAETMSLTNLSEDDYHVHLSFEDGQVVEANGNPNAASRGENRKRTSYLKLQVKADLDQPTADVCFNTGSSTNLADLD